MTSVVRHAIAPRILFCLGFELIALVTLFVALPVWAGGAHARTGESPAHSALLWGGFATSVTLVVQFSLWSFGLYSRELVYAGHRRVLPSLLRGLAFAAVLLVPIYAIFHWTNHPIPGVSPHKYLAAFLAFSLALTVERYLVHRFLTHRVYLGNVLILGTGSATHELLREVHKSHGPSFRLVGILTTRREEIGEHDRECRVLGHIAEIRDHVAQWNVGAILVALPAHSEHLPTEFLLKCKVAGIQVIDAVDFYESIARKVLLERFSPTDLLYRQNLLMTRFRLLSKALFEKTVALTLLVAALPVMALAAALVRLTSEGSVLYRQRRVGQDGRVFTILKFRSMVASAEKDAREIWAEPNDPRITWWGGVMRKTRIDELPQLFNVLRGDMSIVGPRPERPGFVEDLSRRIPHYPSRHLVRPGVTGWAQVAFRYGASLEDTVEKLRHDLYYVKHMSALFDLLIIVSTVRIVLFQSGAR